MAKTAMLLLILLLIPCLGAARVPTIAPLPTTEAFALSLDAGTRDPGDLWEVGTEEYYWTVDGWLTGEETYYSYADVVDCPECRGGWRPVSVTFYVFWQSSCDCSLTVSVGVRDAVGDPGGCPSPGEPICESEPTVVGPVSAPGLWAITLPLPLDAPLATGPFFATVAFHDTCDQLPALVTDSGPCCGCRSWNDWGSGPEELCAHGFPGALSVFATLECQGATPVQTRSWTAIKCMYRTQVGQ